MSTTAPTKLRRLARAFEQAERAAAEATQISDLAGTAAGKAFPISRQVYAGGSLAAADQLFGQLQAAWPAGKIRAAWVVDGNPQANARAVVRTFDGASGQASTAAHKAELKHQAAAKAFISALRDEIASYSPWSAEFILAAASVGIAVTKLAPSDKLRAAVAYLAGEGAAGIAAVAAQAESARGQL